MFPSLRGGNDNPGTKEAFLGEVDDILAAADYLGRQESVDSKRIYLGGHSTGGTLVLLVAECTDRFRAVFSFGPVSDVSYYPDEYIPFDTSNPRRSRPPVPRTVVELDQEPDVHYRRDWWESRIAAGHAALIDQSAGHTSFLCKGATHFSVLAPANQLIAGKILEDAGPTSSLTLTETELNQAVRAVTQGLFESAPGQLPS